VYAIAVQHDAAPRIGPGRAAVDAAVHPGDTGGSSSRSSGDGDRAADPYARIRVVRCGERNMYRIIVNIEAL
jgi:hypothetical protein